MNIIQTIFSDTQTWVPIMSAEGPFHYAVNSINSAHFPDPYEYGHFCAARIRNVADWDAFQYNISWSKWFWNQDQIKNMHSAKEVFTQMADIKSREFYAMATDNLKDPRTASSFIREIADNTREVNRLTHVTSCTVKGLNWQNTVFITARSILLGNGTIIE